MCYYYKSSICAISILWVMNFDDFELDVIECVYAFASTLRENTVFNAMIVKFKNKGHISTSAIWLKNLSFSLKYSGTNIAIIMKIGC